VRRTGGRNDRGFCKIEGRIDRRRWNCSKKVKSFGEGDQRYVFLRPLFFVLFRAWL